MVLSVSMATACYEGVNAFMRTGTGIRIICALLCLSVLLSCTAALAETTKVATYMLRLREKPSTSAKVLDAYPRGTRVTILKKGADWTKVSVHGKVGYMQSDKLLYAKYGNGGSSSGSSSSSSSSAAVKDGATMYVMKGVRLNLRDGASSASDIIGCFRSGTPVTILKKGRYWSNVEVKGYIGYMANEYLTDSPD